MEQEIGSARGDSLEASGESVRKMIQKMDKYILPPQFDFINNDAVEPVVMYFFEFEYKLDRDDLSYIWQNLAPRDYQTITKTSTSVAHALDNNELLSSEDVLDSNMRWMVFKVKQRASTTYDDMVQSQAGESTSTQNIFNDKKSKKQYPIQYNWPYDFVSFVETIKFDAQVLYKGASEDNTSLMTGVTSNVKDHVHAYTAANENGGNGYTEYASHPRNNNVKHRHEIIDGIVQAAQSECYPNCKEVYGVSGIPSHMHAMSEAQVSKTPTQRVKRAAKKSDHKKNTKKTPSRRKPQVRKR